MLRKLIRRALTRTEIQFVGKEKTRKVEVLPSEHLVYGLYFAFLALIALTFLETIHIVFLKAFNSEIFACITTIIGTIFGVFGVKT
jgi:phosphate starvation-inducible membrane PsiE